MRKFNIILSALLAFAAESSFMPSVSSASETGTGTKTSQFLKISAGARAAAMGEAYTAAADDAFALDWNPASVTSIRYKSISMMHSMYLADTSLSYLAYGENTGDMGGWGASVKYMSYGSFDRTDTHAQNIGSLSPYDMALSIAFACYITGFNKDPEERFVMGAAGKFISSKIDNDDNTLSADLGILSPWFFGRHVRFAFSGQNLIGSMRFDKEKDELPRILRGGTVLRFTKHFTLTADTIIYNDYSNVFAAGGEITMSPSYGTELAVRAGFNTRNKDENVKSSGNMSMGGGLKFRDIYSLDYSFSPFGDLGTVHRFSFSINFKRPVNIKKRRRRT